MAQSTITDKFQTTIPLEVRLALKLRPRQRVSYEVRADGSAIMRPAPGLDELFGSLKIKRTAASAREEKQAAREAMARERGVRPNPHGRFNAMHAADVLGEPDEPARGRPR
jgi:bifunctional DNA-binding transcriptional regulator/antitoxin component of YhaV-PrlF toxin-antitoxin module